MRLASDPYNNKDWPMEGFAQLAELVVDDHPVQRAAPCNCSIRWVCSRS